MCRWDVEPLLKRGIDLTIKPDASLMGCLPGSHNREPWTKEEAQMHINCLELLTATFALQMFT